MGIDHLLESNEAVKVCRIVSFTERYGVFLQSVNEKENGTCLHFQGKQTASGG